MSDKVWHIRVRFLDHPPTYWGPYTREEAAEFLATNFAKEQEQLFDITVTRGDFGGEMDRERERQKRLQVPAETRIDQWLKAEANRQRQEAERRLQAIRELLEELQQQQEAS